MESVLFEDWFTVTVTSGGPSSVGQEERGWLDLSACRDVFVWLDVAQVTATGGTLTIQYESAPLREARLFTPVDPTFALVTLAPTSTSIVTALPNDIVGTPAARWFRWNIVASGGIGMPWGATFRLHIVRNRCNVIETVLPATRPLRVGTLAMMQGAFRCPPDPNLQVLVLDDDGHWTRAPTEMGIGPLPGRPCCCPPKPKPDDPTVGVKLG